MTRLIVAPLAALAALSLAAAASAQPPAAASSTAHLDQTRRLVEITHPFEQLLQANIAGWEAAIKQSMSLDPSFKELEEEYPGIGNAGVDAARPMARDYCAQFVKRAMERKAQIFAARLSPSEVTEATRFFETPTGRKLVRQMFANIDVTDMAQDLATQAVRTGNTALSAEAVTAAERTAAEKTVGQISDDDKSMIMRFAGSPAGQKFAEVRAESEREILAMANDPDKAWIAKQQEAIVGAMKAFAARARAR